MGLRVVSDEGGSLWFWRSYLDLPLLRRLILMSIILIMDLYTFEK